MEAAREVVSFSKVKDLSPSTKQVNLVAKVVSVGERRTIDSKFGGSRSLAEAVVGDETGTVVFSLWEGQIDQVGAGDVLQVTNGYVSLVRGRMRLNVGKYGSFEKVTQAIPDVNGQNDLSAQEHDAPPRESRGGYGGGRSGGRSGGYGGGGSRGRSSYGRPRGERIFHGRRRF